jgi:FG-GAP-like repeat/ASPIC and UnbV
LANDFGPYIVEDLLLLNEGDRFVLGDPGAHLVHYGMGAGVGDANQDGLPDLYVTDIGGPDLLLGQGDGTFVDATLASGASLGHDPDRLTSWATRFVDIDGDLYEDLAVAFGRLDAESQEWVGTIDPEFTADEAQRDALLLSDGAGGFRDVGDDVGFDDPARVRPMTIGDLDGDHRPEVIVAGKSDLVLYHVTGGCPSRATLWVDGDDATPAEGARVVLDVDGHEATSWVVGTSTGSSVPPELFLGLNHMETAKVTVVWPDGRTITRTVAAGERLEVSPPVGG